MTDFLQFSETPWLLPVLVTVLLILVGILYRLIRGRGGDFEHTVSLISFDRVERLVIPNADEGEILIDYLLLTSHGLLILEVKDVQGTVFGGDKLQEWTVINDKRRYTFPNPQPALYDRIAAVRQIVREVPVAGRILFLDGADFTKGTPALISSLAQLVSEFAEPDKKAARFKIEAFMPHWELIRKQALSTQFS
jgi:hypothetical protein